MLSTVAKLKRHIGIPEANTSKDAMLETILIGASDFLESQCNRKFGFSEYTDAFTAVDASSLFLRQFPVVEIVQIKNGSTIIDHETLIENDTLIVDYEGGQLINTNNFSGTIIRVTYNAGYLLPENADESGGESGPDVPALPGDIELAAIRMAARTYERRTAEGIASASPGSFSANFSQSLDEDILMTIEKYRKPSC